MTVENVPVTISSSINGLDVVQKGPKPGDKVVTDGQANLVSGNKIRVKTAGNGSNNVDANSSKSRKNHAPNSGGGDS
jgi:multidrug efflux system membrane fusion protein